MRINLTGSQFTLDSGYYYSSPFFIDDKDQLITVELTLTGSGTGSMQSSMSETESAIWVDEEYTDFTCATTGIQTFGDCQLGLYYRVKTATLPVSCRILI